MRGALVSAILLLALACTPAAPQECHPTLAYMRAPDAVVDFFAGGSSQREAARAAWQNGLVNAYGNDAMWVVLPKDGELVGRLDDKIGPYRLKPGQVLYEARRLDGPGRVSRRPVGTPGYGDLGFQAGGPEFPSVGCWEVTYTLDGRDPLRFVLNVR